MQWHARTQISNHNIIITSEQIHMSFYIHLSIRLEYRDLGNAYRPYNQVTVDLGDPCNLTEHFKQFGLIRSCTLPVWPQLPKMALPL